jgi:hypothetical protein
VAAPRSKVPLYLALVGSTILAVALAPPEALVELIKSDAWAHAAIGLLLFLVLALVLNVLGLADGEITLPFGLGARNGASAGMLEALRSADESLFEIADETTVAMGGLEARARRDRVAVRRDVAALTQRIDALERDARIGDPALTEEP